MTFRDGDLKSPERLNRLMGQPKSSGVDGVIFFRWHSLQPFLPRVAPHLRAWPKAP